VSADFLQQNPRTSQALARVAVNTLKYIKNNGADQIVAKLPGQLFYPDGNQAAFAAFAAFAAILKANVGMFSPDGAMPSEGPSKVLETLKAADPQTSWSTVDQSKAFTNTLVQAVS
jgi:NitT/TauT family transport system substrate-binding protein